MDSQEIFINREEARLLKKYNCSAIDDVIKVLKARLAEQFIP